MTNSQTLQLRMSEIRQKLMSDTKMESTERDKLTAEFADCESKYRAAVVVENEERNRDLDTESRARDLIGRVELRSYFDAAISETPLAGAERELNEELKAADNVIPWAAFVPEDDPEERADDTTSVTGNVQRTSQNPLARIMASAASTYAGIQTVTVPAGERQFVAMTGGASASTLARGAGIEADAATFTTVEAKPTRGSIRYKWDLESQAVMPTLENALRADASEVLRLHLDYQALFGNGTAPNPQGLITGITAPTNPTAVVKAHDIFANAVSLVDGKVATGASSVRILLGPKTYQKVVVEQVNNSKEYVLPRVTGQIAGTRVSGQFPAPASNIEHGLAIATGNPTSVFVPVWGPGPTAILDRYTESAKAVTALTLHYLYNVVRLRTEQYKRLAYKVA